MHLSRGTRIGPYEIVEPLGAGGMGEVYRATDHRLARDVAVKVLPRHVVDDVLVRARFQREAKAIASLSHPNVLAIFDVGGDETPFIVTELLEGSTLRTRLLDGPLPWRKAIDLSAFVADGLAAAHAKGITHRDLKPENIFLTSDGRVKILDFGLARQFRLPSPGQADAPTEEMKTMEGRVVGTVGYLAPEQLRGDEADGRADLFALGCVLFEMIWGRNPFVRESGADTLTAILRDDPMEDPHLGVQAPPEVLQIVRRCLEKDRTQRFQSALDLAFALRALASTPTATLARRVAIRRAGIAAAVIALLGVTAAAVWMGRGRSEAARPIDSLAVLPFATQGSNPSIEYVADGLTESLIDSLSRLPRMSVMSASSVFRFKGRELDPRLAGKDLHVDVLLLGRLDRSGDQIRLSAELVDARTGRHLWGRRYERPASQVMTLHEEIAADVSEQLRLGEDRTLPERRVTANPAAYEAYVKGRYYWNQRTPAAFERAIASFREAIELDRSYALAWAGLADAYILQALYGQVPPREVLARARDAALQALRIERDLPEAHTSLAYLYRNEDGDPERATVEFRRALEINPNYATAHHWHGLALADLANVPTAIAAMERATQLDPLSPAIQADYAGILNDAGRLADAQARIAKAFELDPNFPFAHHIQAEIHLRRGDAPAAVASASRAWELGRDPRVLLRLAQAHALAGRTDQARQVLGGLEREARVRFVSPLVMARVAMVVGDHEKALASLGEAVQVIPHGALARSLDRDPLFADLHDDSRFVAVRKSLAAP